MKQDMAERFDALDIGNTKSVIKFFIDSGLGVKLVERVIGDMIVSVGNKQFVNNGVLYAINKLFNDCIVVMVKGIVPVKRDEYVSISNELLVCHGDGVKGYIGNTIVQSYIGNAGSIRPYLSDSDCIFISEVVDFFTSDFIVNNYYHSHSFTVEDFDNVVKEFSDFYDTLVADGNGLDKYIK